MKKRKLKRWVKRTLIIIGLTAGIIVFYALAKDSANDWNYWANKCDTDRGYTCSYYDVRQTMIRGE